MCFDVSNVLISSLCILVLFQINHIKKKVNPNICSWEAVLNVKSTEDWCGPEGGISLRMDATKTL